MRFYKLISAILVKIRDLFRNVGGNIAITTAIAAVPLFGAVGMGIDYTRLNTKKWMLQEAADSAALASAKELAVSNQNPQILEAIAEEYARANLGSDTEVAKTKIYTELSPDGDVVTINISHYWEPFLLQYVGANVLPIKVAASAKLVGGNAICMIALDPKKSKSIHLKKRASLKANDCGIYANSKSKNAIRVDNDAIISAQLVCAVGGIKQKKRADFDSTAITDCPSVADPLAGRVEARIRNCDFKKFTINSGKHTLNPGTYCKGLRVGGTAEVWLNPGIYIIDRGKLEITDNAVLAGNGVGFFLSDAKLKFRKDTTISLSAPTNGEMAGLLFFEERSASDLVKHQITSNDARQLIGTIYLPNGTLRIDSDAPIADQSAFTAIVARNIELDEGPVLQLNSDYKATDVPLPDGLVGTYPILTK